ncbi:MAG: hypothetical protein Q7R95_06675 [bacterium]|nr:hypothetical protein [bacterium]
MTREDTLGKTSWEKNHADLAEHCLSHVIKVATPDSTLVHPWKRDSIASFTREEWENLIWEMEQIEMSEYYIEHRGMKEYKDWLSSEIDIQNPVDQTKSVAAQLYALQIAPKGTVVVLGGGLGFNLARLVTGVDTDNKIVSTAALGSEGLEEQKLIQKLDLKNRIYLEPEIDYVTYLNSLPDNSISTIVLDWTLSRVKDPHILFDLINRKLILDGIYVHTDRKAFEELKPERFGIDGIAHIPERRSIECFDGVERQFWVAKQFVQDLPRELAANGFQILYDTKNDQDCIYDIAIAKKTSGFLQPFSTNQLLNSTLPNINIARQKLVQALK